MSRLFLTSVAKLADEPLELYWLAGLERRCQDAWFVRAVFRNMASGRFYLTTLPIGLLPMLSLGYAFEFGERSAQPVRGESLSVDIPDASYEVLTSGEIPTDLYSFDGHPAGVQRLFRLRSSNGVVLIPAIEWIRYLFLHNRTMANAVMRPGALNLLFWPQAPGFQTHRALRFTSEMPARCLSERFVKEFAWLALDPEARRSWDSVAALSADQPFVSFAPPSLRRTTWRFRGVQHGNTYLVLELQHMSGRRVPCESLEYAHPKLAQIVRIDRSGKSEGPRQGGNSDGGNNEGRTKIEFELDDGQEGSGTNASTKGTQGVWKTLEFENQVAVKAQRQIIERISPPGPGGNGSGGGDPSGTTKTIRVSAGERAGGARLPPIEFTLLEAAPTDRMGNLNALEETIRHMRDKLPGVDFSMNLCRLKPGRAFSQIGREPRNAMIVIVSRPGNAPILLLDVERTGVPALSLLALRFRSEATTLGQVERVAKAMLDGLVDGGGHWNTDVEACLEAVCVSERLPKLLFPREQVEMRAKLWALRLAEKLGLDN